MSFVKIYSRRILTSLFMLVVFLMSFSSCRKSNSPEKITLHPKEQPRVLLKISIDKNGELFFKGRRVSLEGVEKICQKNAAEYGADIVVMFTAPPEVHYKVVKAVVMGISFSRGSLYEFMFALPGKPPLRCTSDAVVSCGPPGLIDIIVNISPANSQKNQPADSKVTYKLSFRKDYDSSELDKAQGLTGRVVTATELRQLALSEKYQGHSFIIKLSPEDDVSFGKFYKTIKLVTPDSDTWPELYIAAFCKIP